MHRRDFGSFHSSNIEELINLSEKDYIPPDNPFEFPSFNDYLENPILLGCSTRKKHFLLEDCTFINHGAFGGVFKEAMDVAQKWQIYTERQPLRVIDRQLIPQLAHMTRRLASFVGCPPNELVLVNNATSAINAVVQSLSFKPGDKIFCLSVTYGAVKKLLRHICVQTGVVLQEEAVEFPIRSEEQIIDLVKLRLEPGTSLAVFDHIPSNTPFISPLEKIIPVCKERGVPVLIDGAHGLGSLPLNLQELQADYYVSNAHKWFCSPKGCAFLYVKKELQSQIHPCIISHGYGAGFHSEFVWQGLRDYSPFIALSTVIDFWQSVGPHKIRTYIYSLVRQAATMLAEKWSTGLAAPLDMFGPMALIRLPSVLYEDVEVNYNIAEGIQNTLFHRYNIEVPVKSVQGQLYVRISAHMYNEMAEYYTLADAILQLTKEQSEKKTSSVDDPRTTVPS